MDKAIETFTKATVMSLLSTRWINIVLAILIVGGVFFFVDLEEVLQSILSIPLPVLTVVFGLATADRIFMGYKWRHLILAAGGILQLGHTVSAYYQSAISGRLIPVPFGAEALRAHLVCAAGVPGGIVLGSMAMEKLLAFLGTSFLGLAGLVYLLTGLEKEIHGLFLYCSLMSLAIGGLLLWILLFGPAHKMGGRLSRLYLPQKCIAPLRNISQTILVYKKKPRVICVNMLLVFAEHALQLSKLYIMGRALNIDLSLGIFLAVLSLTMFVRRITGYIEGVGLGEVGSVFVLVLSGVQREIAVALILMNYAVTFAASLPGVYLLYRSGTRLAASVAPKKARNS